MLPSTYKMWAERQRLCHGYRQKPYKHICYSERQAISWSAQWLIERLYVPCSIRTHPSGTILSRGVNKLTKPFDVESEAINWGDLAVRDVVKHGGLWYVLIEEAFPDCSQLCGYIRSWLNKWGWQVIVETEW